MGFRQKLSLVLLVVLIVALIRWLTGPDQGGQVYSSLETLKKAQQAAGSVPIGFFGDSWPATVVEALEGDDTISFTRKNGTPHTYTGFDGEPLKVLRLRDMSDEVTVVFRSALGQAAPEPGPVRRL